MRNLALEATGAQVCHSTSWDHAHPPEAAIDGSDVTFWSTTGLFPQELVLSFDSVIQVETIETRTFNAKGVKIFRSMAAFPSDFIEMCSSEIPNGEGTQQRFKHEIRETAARHLKLVFTSGWDDFIGVYSVSVFGDNVDLKQR